MKPRIFAILAFLAGFSFFKSQLTAHRLLHAGYVYQNQSFGEIGGRLLFLNNDDFIFRLGASGLFGVSGARFAALPKVQGDILVNTEKNVDFYHSYYFLAGAEATTKYIAPKAGATLFGLLDVTAGYAFPFGDKGLNGKQLKGLNINLTLNVPVVLIHDLTH